MASQVCATSFSSFRKVLRTHTWGTRILVFRLSFDNRPTHMLDRLYPGKKEHGWTPLIWLMYLVFFVVGPFWAHDNRLLVWTGTVLATALFVPVYLQAYSASGRRAALVLATMAGLGIFCTPWNSGGMTFFIYAAACAPWMYSGAKLWSSLSAFLVIMLVEGVLLHFPMFVPLMMALVAVGTCAANYHLAQKKLADRKLQLAQDEVEYLAKVAERERIARDLHDVLGHTLSLITLKAELARRLIDRDPQRARQEMLELEQTSRAALADVRETISGYRGHGLAAELVRLRKTVETAGLALQTEIADVPLAPAQETVLTLALREAVTNILRHAGAQVCRIRLQREDGYCTLEIADDGRGSSAREGQGLRGMRERVEALGGSLQRQNQEGTRLTIRLPLNHPRRNDAHSSVPGSAVGN